MFRTYYFNEMPYPYVPSEEFVFTIRGTMPNRWFDPDAGREVYHKYFDLVQAADELGLDVMFNEHHASMNNMPAAMPLTMAIAARETAYARGFWPLVIRWLIDPTHCTCGDRDGHDRRRKWGPARLRLCPKHPVRTPSNQRQSPIDIKARMYEAIDLIVKAWTSHDGPFSWEGEFFQHREVDIVRGQFQSPHPPFGSQRPRWVLARRSQDESTRLPPFSWEEDLLGPVQRVPSRGKPTGESRAPS